MAPEAIDTAIANTVGFERDFYSDLNAMNAAEKFEGSVWLTKDGWITPVYEQRGIWQTWEEAQEALRRA